MANLSNLAKTLDTEGRSPSVKMEVQPIDNVDRGGFSKPFTLDGFNSYHFASNILVPVDAFSFVFKPPMPRNNSETWNKIIRPGDLLQLTINDQPLATGFCTVPEISTDDDGSVIHFEGLDMLGYLESSDAVTPSSNIIYANSAKIEEVIGKLIENTRIDQLGYEIQGVPKDVASLFATQPGESKLASLQRFLDPLNAIAWTSPSGKLVVGRPDFSSDSQGTLGFRVMGDGVRRGNVLNMRIRDQSAQIPNSVIVVWTGNEGLASVQKQNERRNSAEGPSRLYKAGHTLYRCLPTSVPDANDVKDGLSELNRLIAQGGDYLGALAAREFARENTNELVVTCSVYGHLNSLGNPFVVNTCYDLVHDAAGLDEKMYLFGVDYELSESGGQITHLSFCKLNTIVASSGAVKSFYSDINLGVFA